MRSTSMLFVTLTFMSSCAAPTQKPPATASEPAPRASTRADSHELARRIARYATPALTADVSQLPDSEQATLKAIIEAARELEPIFDRQAYAGNPALLANASGDARRFLRLMRGPWDRQNHFEPVLTNLPHPPGAGFYPEDMSVEEFRAHLAKHPEDKDALESLYTMIERRNGALVAVPYSQFFNTELTRASTALKRAAQLTQNASLKAFLESRAQAFLTDDYYESDKLWMDLDSPVEVTIGPYEVYEDELLALKASFEAFVTVADPAASAQLEKVKQALPDMEMNLPIPDAMKTARGAESPIRVVDLVFTSGDARKSVQTIAFNLPNDERVRKEKGAKKVMLRNAIQTKFDAILRPLAAEILHASQQSLLSGEAFFQAVLFHELSHSLGPAFVKNDEKLGDVRVALGPSYSALEECKADVMGIYNILFLIERGELPRAWRESVLVSYFAGLFRSVRFGIAEAHGKGAAVQLKRYLDAGAGKVDEDGRFTVDLDKLVSANKALLTDLLVLQHGGDRGAAEAFLAENAVLPESVTQALAGLEHVPVDIRPVFPLAGETGDPLAL